MNIRPSAVIRNNYNDISNFCKTTGEPVYLTKNGEGDLVVMDIEAFSRREKMLKLREELIAAEEERLMGKKDILLTSFIKYLEMQQRRVMPNKKYTVIVSDRAASMLVNHVRFLTRVSHEAAKNFIKIL